MNSLIVSNAVLWRKILCLTKQGPSGTTPCARFWITWSLRRWQAAVDKWISQWRSDNNWLITSDLATAYFVYLLYHRGLRTSAMRVIDKWSPHIIQDIWFWFVRIPGCLDLQFDGLTVSSFQSIAFRVKYIYICVLFYLRRGWFARSDTKLQIWSRNVKDKLNKPWTHGSAVNACILGLHRMVDERGSEYVAGVNVENERRTLRYVCGQVPDSKSQILQLNSKRRSNRVSPSSPGKILARWPSTI